MLVAEIDSPLDGLAEALHITRSELGAASGLSRDAISKTARRNAPATVARLRDIAEILNRTAVWAGSLPQAYAWYRAQPLPSFGDQTAEDLVKQGRAEAVKAYLSRIAVGGFA
jgi:transcriptional regulator with XRE-family HTH domain